MSPSTSSASQDFPRLCGPQNFEVWKTRVEAALDGKGLLGFIAQRDYQGDSDGEDDNDAPFNLSEDERALDPSADDTQSEATTSSSSSGSDADGDSLMPSAVGSDTTFENSHNCPANFGNNPHRFAALTYIGLHFRNRQLHRAIAHHLQHQGAVEFDVGLHQGGRRRHFTQQRTQLRRIRGVCPLTAGEHFAPAIG